MKIARMFTIAVLMAALFPAAGALAASQQMTSSAPRIGLGLNLDRIDVRAEVRPELAVGGFLKFDMISSSEDALEGSLLGVGVYALVRTNMAKPAMLHFMGGLSILTASDRGSLLLPWDQMLATEGYKGFTDVALFAGIGSEYFLPGTDQFSIEGDLGLALHFTSYKTDDDSDSATRISLEDLTGAVVMLRYYFR